MNRVLCWATALSMAALAWGAVPAQKKSTARKTTVRKSAARKTTAAKRSPSKSAPARQTTAKNSKNSKKAPSVTWRNRQMSPSSDRYHEIQDALVTRGYLKPESATGGWDQASSDALKRFQADQKIDTTGKINSLSLIALGLGPRHETTIAASPEQIPNH